MKFNTFQIKKIIEVINKNTAVFIGSNLGIEYMSDYDKYLLKLYGIDLDSIQTMNQIEQMFYFGIYSSMIGGKKSFRVKRADFEDWFQKELQKPISTQRKATLDFIKQRAFTDITGLGNRVTGSLNNKILTASIQERNKVRRQIAKISKKGIKEGYNQAKMSQIMRQVTEDWARDFSRISDYILQETYAWGRLAQIVETYGEDCKVYKQTFPGVCKHCEANYGTPNEEPIVYSIDELIQNGTNIGRKEQLPVVGQAHPFARSILHAVPPNSEWDNVKKQFVVKRNTQGVKRTSRAKITITR